MLDWIKLFVNLLMPVISISAIFLVLFGLPFIYHKFGRLKFTTQEKTMLYEKIKEEALILIKKEITEVNDANYERYINTWKKCPQCNSTNTVNKYARVKGDVSGDFFLGIGGVNGSIDTEMVKQCSDCGNQYQGSNRSSSVTITDAIENLHRYAYIDIPVTDWGRYGKTLVSLENKYGREKVFFFILNAYDRMDGGSLFPTSSAI